MGFFWVKLNSCADNSANFDWPENYSDVYIKSDGYLHDSDDMDWGIIIPNGDACN